jgi:hypothetical protein
MNTRVRMLASVLAALGAVGPTLADPDADGWVPRKPATKPQPVIRVGLESGPPIELPPPTVDLPEVPSIPDPPERLPAPTDVADPPTPPVPPGRATIDPNVSTPADPVTAIFGYCPRGLWAEFDYLQWWYRGAALPVLVTAGAAADPSPGALGQPSTRVLYGGGSNGTEWANGIRLRIGGPLDPYSPYGWEVGWFHTQPQSATAAFASRDSEVLARPFYDTLRGVSASSLVGLPGLVDGVMSVRTRTSLWGVDAHATMAVSDSNTAFVGFQRIELTDDVRVLTQDQVGGIGSFIAGTALPPGSFLAQGDHFNVRNQFNGAQVGWRYVHGFGRVGIDLRGSLAVGVNSERVTIEGATQTVDPLGVGRGVPAGFLTLPSNSGRFDRDQFTCIPQLTARVTYEIKPGIQLFAGYDFLYWARVARAGDQIDLGQDPRQNPSSATFSGDRGARPAVLMRDTDFWAHGVSFGLRVEY